MPVQLTSSLWRISKFETSKIFSPYIFLWCSILFTIYWTVWLDFSHCFVGARQAIEQRFISAGTYETMRTGSLPYFGRLGVKPYFNQRRALEGGGQIMPTTCACPHRYFWHSGGSANDSFPLDTVGCAFTYISGLLWDHFSFNSSTLLHSFSVYIGVRSSRYADLRHLWW